jgi:predicted choloylglycine hydrolase
MARTWYLKEGLAARPTPTEGRDALARHMPELLPIYDTLCGLAGTDEVAHRMLSNYDPPPVIAGCSQAAWIGAGGPALVRNYDFDVAFTTRCIELYGAERARRAIGTCSGTRRVRRVVE